MASQAYRDRLQRAVDVLPDEKAVQVVELAERLCGEQAEQRRKRVRLGTLRGQIKILPSFFDPLPDDIIDAFEGKGE